MPTTWDPGRLGPQTTLSGGNLVATEGSTTYPIGEAVFSTDPLTGVGIIGCRTSAAGLVFGIADGTASPSGFPGIDTHGFSSYSAAGQMVYNGALTGSSPTWTGGDLVEMNYDEPGRQIRFRVNGGAYGSFQSLVGKITGPFYAAAGYFTAGETLTLYPARSEILRRPVWRADHLLRR